MRAELIRIAKRAVLLDIAAYLVSILFVGVTLAFAAGLVLGTGVLIGSLMLLRQSLKRMAAEAKRYGITNRKRYQLFYALRLLLFAAGFGTAVVLRRWISPLAAALPMLYPRLIYTAEAVFHRFGSPDGNKKR